MTKTVSFKVGMTCSGCQGAVTKVLSRVEGVKKVDANLTTKKVDVECEDEVDSSKLMDALKKWSGSSGKSVEEWN